MFNGKPAKDCTREEIAREVWLQIKAHLEDNGESVLPDDILHSWFLDPGIAWSTQARARTSTTTRCSSTRSGRGTSARRRATDVPNLFLAGDYVQTTSTWRRWRARTSPAAPRRTRCCTPRAPPPTPATMYELYRPPEFEPSKQADAELYRAGLPNALDRPR